MTITRRDFGKLAARTGAGLAGLSAIGAPLRLGAESAAGVIRAHGVSAFGDLGYPADFTHFAYANPDAPVGGTFSTGGGPITFDSLHPFVLKGNPATLVTLSFDTLMTSADDEPDSMYGLLAHAIEYPEDRMWAAFELREEARFADGTQVTAEDVVFSFTTLIEKGHPSYRLQLAGVSNVAAEGPQRVRFEFSPDAARRDLPMAVAGVPVMSRAWWEGKDFAESTLEPILGSGPYEVGEVEPGRTLSMRRRPEYWGWDLPVNRGRYNFETIRFEYFRDRAASFEAFKAGRFVFNEEFWSKLWATGYDFPAVQRGDVVRETIPDNRPAGTQGFWFNLRREKFADPRVREAMGLCFDFEWSNRTLFYELYTRTDSLFEGGTMEAAGPPTPGELALLEPLRGQVPDSVFGPAFVPNATDGSGRNRRALRRAAKLLDEAGWTLEGNTRVKDGTPLEVEFLLTSPAFERITSPYVQNLMKIGVQATQRTIDPAQYEQRMDEFDFDITVRRYAMSLTPGVELRQIFYSTSADAPGSNNIAGIKNPAVDALIDTVERAEDRETLTDAVKALDRVLRAMHVWVPQWSKASHHLAYWDIFGRPDMKPEYARGVVDNWWVDQEKLARLSDRIGG